MENQNDYLTEVTEEIVESAKKANPGKRLVFVEITLDDGKIFQGVFIDPDNATTARYMSSSSKSKDNQIPPALALVRDSAVYPSYDDFYEMQRFLPFLPISVANELMKGHGIATDSKKKSL